MNIPQHYPQREKSVRTLTSDNLEQACAARGRENQPHLQNKE